MKLSPKHLFRSKKSRSLSKSTPSFNSYTTSSDSPESSLGHVSTKSTGIITPTSVLGPTDSRNSHSHSREIETSSDEWSEISTNVQFELIQAFKFIDTDGDGKITREQLENLLSRISGSGSGDVLSVMLSEIDKDGDGVITLEEFGAISSVFGSPACDTELREVFDFFDTDHDGKITADELFEVFKSFGDGKCTLDECTKMISNVDKNGDGFVCFEDFTIMMHQQQQR
ncbi:probable calcium-binding protein CML36 [Rutidosis leptorrhynchoides]|uniref:probable calcium-binding protein CML36 n=1 Tax=Rutidosis leptorrhynchoides TaxID=125765 RepID=UPI003A990B44